MNLKINKTIFLVAVLFSLGCYSQKKKTASGYNLEEPVKFDLPKDIDQISGIVYSNDNSVYAVDDDNSAVYKVSLQPNPQVQKWKFEKGNDTEDLVILKNTFYTLNSAGTILSFSLPASQTLRYDLPLKGKNEFESLFYETSSNQLIMLCKECGDDKKNETSAYAFDLNTNAFLPATAFKIQKKDIEKKVGSIERFKPSAATINPITKELYVVSSVNKLLVVLDAARKVKEAYKLDSKLFRQPEGIAFTTSGDMLISNEGSSKTPANILMFKKQ
ncbi:MAG: hypothetical protein JWQ96_146 [Segetibacter sp.]|nr:hypothetical protein [Segetibacter sp.]